MVKKLLSTILTIGMLGVGIGSCIIPKEVNLIVTTREKNENIEFVIIDDEVIALSGNPNLINTACILILNDINVQRSAAGLDSLIQTNELMAAAAIRAQEQEKLFSHTRPNGSEWWTVDSTCCYGECLSKGYNENEVINAWMNSPTHKAVIMDGTYKTAGIGVYENDVTCFIALETGY